MKPSPASMEQGCALGPWGGKTHLAQQSPKQWQHCFTVSGQTGLHFVETKPPFFPPLPICKSGKWRLDLVKGTQSDPNSYKISSFQRCHYPLTMSHPARCGPAPASGRQLQEVGRSHGKAFQLFGGGGAFIPVLSSRSCACCLPQHPLIIIPV